MAKSSISGAAAFCVILAAAAHAETFTIPWSDKALDEVGAKIKAGDVLRFTNPDGSVGFTWNADQGFLDGERAMRAGDFATTAVKVRPLALTGDARAQTRMAFLLSNAKGVPLDEKQALEWDRKAVDQGYVFAMFSTGWILDHAKSFPRDPVRAAAAYGKAAAHGYARAQHALAGCFRRGDGVPQDAAKALEWDLKAAAQGEPESALTLCQIYADGYGVARSVTKAIAFCEDAANHGSGHIRFNVARMYESGDRIAQDDGRASYWFQEAAKKGGLEPLDGAEISMRGIAGGPGLEKARQALEGIAEGGDAKAKFSAAVAYSHGRSQEDLERAVYWYKAAAEDGFAPAEYNLSLCYAEGKGVEKDDGEALRWRQAAAQQGVGDHRVVRKAKQRR